MESKSEIQTFVLPTGGVFMGDIQQRIQAFLDQHEIDTIHSIAMDSYKVIILAEGKKTRLE